MSEKPILLSSAMVKAIIEDRKTQTRRVIKPQPIVRESGCPAWSREDGKRIPNGPRRAFGGAKVAMNDLIVEYCPYGQIGSRLWVRETWAHLWDLRTNDPGPYALASGFFYRADYPDGISHDDNPSEDLKWRPSIFMPRNASRISLEITNVRVERLQEITVTDIIAEGVELGTVTADFTDKHTPAWIKGWNEINAKRGYTWESNPWVWVLTFKRVI